MDRQEYMKQYRLANKQKYAEYRKKWYENNKDIEENKQKKNTLARNYYQNVTKQKKHISVENTETS